MKTPGAILVICVRYLGDTLLLRPALRALRKAHPGARIDALVASGTGVALEGCGDVDRVLEWPKGGGLFPVAGLLGRLAAGGYDLAFDFTGNDRSSLAALCSLAKTRVAYERPKSQRNSLRSLAFNKRVPPKKPKPHIVIQRLDLLAACGVPDDGTSCGIVPDPGALERVDVLTRGLPARRIHIHPTSRDMQKALPVAVLRSVVEGALAAGWGVVVTSGGAAAEQSHVQQALGASAENCRFFCDVSWQELTALVSRASCYWGADTAPAHLASALGVPSRIEFGPSDATHWEPLHAGGVASVHPCPCRKKGASNKCPVGRPGACLEGIHPEEVLAWAESVAR